jgi:hypothetical protein
MECAGLRVWLVGGSAGGRTDVDKLSARPTAGGAFGGAVADQGGDGAVGFAVGLTALGVPLERAPLAVFGVGVFDADASGGLAASVLAPAVPFGQRAVSSSRPFGLRGGAETWPGNSFARPR